jgi:hypothetical protein
MAPATVHGVTDAEKLMSDPRAPARERSLGHRVWAIADGYIPGQGLDRGRALVSHEALCFLNTGSEAADVSLTVYFRDREPAGPYRLQVGARRTLHLRLNDLTDPEPIPRDTDYACLVEASVPVVVQHTRLDSRAAEVALLSTVAYHA